MTGKGAETETRASLESRNVDPSGKAALVASQALMGPVERSEPPRIPQPGRLHAHGPPSSANFQPPPVQPPQLTQAPGISAIDAARLGAVIPSSLQRPPHHMAFMQGHSPRPPMAIRGEIPHSSHMIRSLSAEDLRKRRSPNSAVLLDRQHSSADRHLERGGQHPERRGHPPDRHPQERHHSERFMVNQPPPGQLPPQINMQTPAGSTAQFLAVPSFARAPVMSAGQHTIEELKARGEDPGMFKPPDQDQRVPQELHRAPGPPGHDWPTFKCRQCGQSFNQKNAYERHNCVPEGSKPFQHGPEGAKPFQCGRCQLSFPDAGTLQEHMLIHTSDRPFKCGFCSRSFSGADSLNSHMRVHMNENPEQVKKEDRNTPVSCPKCGRRFIHLMDLNKHFSPSGECLT